MSSKNFFLLVFVLFLCGCSNDSPSSGTDNPLVSVVPDFKVLGADLSNMYQFNYSADAESGQTVNLTSENAIGNQFLTLRQVEEVLTFYTFAFGSFSAIQRNLETGEFRTLQDIYTVQDDRSVIWGANSGETIFFGYYSPQGSRNFGMRSIDITSRETVDIAIEDNVQNVYEPLYYKGKLFVAYRDLNGNNVVAVFDTTNSELIRSWDFGGSNASFFIEAAGDIAVITNVAGNEYRQTIYDFDTLDAKSEDGFIVERFFAPGPLEAELVADRLYYLNFEASPSSVPYSPAIFDFIRDENIILDLFGIVQQLEQELGKNISFTSYRYLPSGRVFLFGYTVDFNGGTFNGGIMVISEQGELLENIETPFVPIYFIKNP